MKLENIKFTTMQDGNALPDVITVSITLEEALNISQQFGELSTLKRDELRLFSDSIWSCLNSNVFNRYWDGGDDDARDYARQNQND